MYRYCSLSCIGKIKKTGRKIHYFTPVLKKYIGQKRRGSRQLRPAAQTALAKQTAKKKQTST
jgi:hypothetical protein